MKKNRKKTKEIKDYDDHDTTGMVDVTKPLCLEDLGLKLPTQPPTRVISIRMPRDLLNEIQAYSSERDIPYQVLIKLMLSESIRKMKKRAA